MEGELTNEKDKIVENVVQYLGVYILMLERLKPFSRMELESSFGAEERLIERPFSEEEIKIAIFSNEENISQMDSHRSFFFFFTNAGRL